MPQRTGLGSSPFLLRGEEWILVTIPPPWGKNGLRAQRTSSLYWRLNYYIKNYAMADEFVAVCIAVFTTLIVSWLFSPLDKLCKSWNYWRCFQNRLPEGVRPFSEIPGPRGLPYFGNVIQHIMNAKSLQLAFAQKQLFERYGPIFKETVMGETHVYLKSPTDLEAVFKAEGKYPKRASDVMTALGKYFKSRNKVVASFGLL